MSKGKATRTRATAGAERTKTDKPRSNGKAKATRKRKNKPKREPKPLPTERRLTVATMRRAGSYDCTGSPDETIVPSLRLAGRWMEAAGFVQGVRVLVQVEPERLVVTRAPALPAPPAPTDWASER